MHLMQKRKQVNNMDIVKDSQIIKIEDQKYIVAFDMTSIALYKTMTGKGVLHSLSSLLKNDDETLISFMAATIRPIESPDKPLGNKIYKMNLFNLILFHSTSVIVIISGSMPQSGEKTAKK